MAHDRPQSDPHGSSESMLVFRVGALSLAIRGRYVDQLHAPPQITPIPLAPSYIAGLAIFRGEVVPLIDIGRFLELEEPSELTGDDAHKGRSSSFARVAVVSARGMQVGILCSEVKGLVPLSATTEQEERVARGGRLERVVETEVNARDGVIVVIDVPKLLEEARVKL